MQQRLSAGQLDRLLTIEQKLVARESAFGSESVNWVPFASGVRARQDELSGVETVRQDQRVMTRRVTFTIRWRDGVSTAMRVRLPDDRVFQIVSALELGRHYGLRLECEEYSV